MDSKKLLRFTKTLVGKYSNEEQSILNPMIYAHINIFFQPLSLEIFNEPIIYSEQSYDYSPWSPYRQSLHKIKCKNQYIILESYKINCPERFAGAGFMPELLKELKGYKLIKREGCSMLFKEIEMGVYIGEVEAGNLCLIKHSGKVTYLCSKVKFDNHSWTAIDQGFDNLSHEKVWGTDHGAIKFKKVNNLSSRIKDDYFN